MGEWSSEWRPKDRTIVYYLCSLMYSVVTVSATCMGLVPIRKNEINYVIFLLVIYTRRSRRYAPILLAPVEGWGPFGPLKALLGAFALQ